MFARTMIALSIRIESAADVVPFTLFIPGFALIAFSDAIGVPRFENTTDIVVFPAEEDDDEMGFDDFVHPNIINEKIRKTIILLVVISFSFFGYKVIHCAEKELNRSSFYLLSF